MLRFLSCAIRHMSEWRKSLLNSLWSPGMVQWSERWGRHGNTMLEILEEQQALVCMLLSCSHLGWPKATTRQWSSAPFWSRKCTSYKSQEEQRCSRHLLLQIRTGRGTRDGNLSKHQFALWSLSEIGGKKQTAAYIMNNGPRASFTCGSWLGGEVRFSMKMQQISVLLGFCFWA